MEEEVDAGSGEVNKVLVVSGAESSISELVLFCDCVSVESEKEENWLDVEPEDEVDELTTPHEEMRTKASNDKRIQLFFISCFSPSGLAGLLPLEGAMSWFLSLLEQANVSKVNLWKH